MDKLFIEQAVKTNVILEPHELGSQYEQVIHNRIMNKYGDHSLMNGYVLRSTIKIIKIENGVRMGSHLHGFMTFMVEFSAVFCIPTKM